MSVLQRAPDVVICVHIEGVQVHSQGAGKEDRVLRDDGDPGAQLVEADGRYIDTIDKNLAAHRLHYSEI